MENFTAEITKAEFLCKQYNSMVANNWIKINARIYNSEKTRYKKIRFVVLIDADDLYEYYYDDDKSEEENMERGYSKKDVLQMARELALNDIYCFVNDYNNINELIDYANGTIEKYNQCGTWGNIL